MVGLLQLMSPRQMALRWGRGALGLLSAGAYTVGLLVWLLQGWGDLSYLSSPMLVRMPLMAVAALLAVVAASDDRLHPATRRIWAWLSAAFGVLALSDVVPVQMVLDLGGHLLPVKATGYLLGYLIALGGAVRYLIAWAGRSDYRLVLLDLAIMAASASLPLTVLTVQQRGIVSLGELTIDSSLRLLMLLMIFQCLTVIIQQRFGRSSWVSLSFIVAAISSLLADLTGTNGFLSPWTDVSLSGALLRTSSTWLLVLAAFVQRLPGCDPMLVPPRPIRSVVSPLPYLVLLLVHGLLVMQLANSWPQPVALLAGGSLVITLLVVIRQLIGVAQNHRRLIERAARQGEERFRALVQHSSDAIAIVSATGLIHYLTPSARSVFGHAPEVLQGRWLTTLAHGEDVERLQAALREVASKPRRVVLVEWTLPHRLGGRSIASVCTNLLDEPSIGGIVVNSRDISEPKALEEQLRHQTFHDALTGLVNRMVFMERTVHALVQSYRRQRSVAILLIDIDAFHSINDRFGYTAGDTLLKIVANRLVTGVPVGDTVARLGGDEFAILLEETSAEEARQIGQQLIDTLAAPVLVAGSPLVLQAGCGVAIAQPGRSASDLLRDAAAALQLAKRQASGQVVSFDDTVRWRFELGTALQTALEQQQFVLHYQPIVDLVTARVVACEALVRWQHPEYGLIMPDEFIPMAEETGLVVPLGCWIMGEACRQLRAWQAAWPAARGVRVSINVSPQQLQHQGLLSEVIVNLRRHRLDPASLVLEITESAMVQATEVVTERLQALKQLGVGLAIDDFGTGYSNLSTIHQLPIDTIKIDRSFVSRLGHDRETTMLLKAIRDLADTLGLAMVLEGLEGSEQREQVIRLGYRLGQGFLFASPAPGDQFGHLFRQPAPSL